MDIVKNIISYMKKEIISYSRKEEKGSITVEAAFVMPIVVLTVFALIYLAFFLHDYNRIVGMVDLVAYRAGIAGKHEADIATGRISYEDINDRGVFYLLTGDSRAEELKIIKLLEEELSKGLFISKVSNTEVKAGKLEININIQAEAKVNLPLFKNLMDKMFMIKLECTYPVHNPAEAIRVWEVILDTGSKIKGVNQLKDAIEKFIR